MSNDPTNSVTALKEVMALRIRLQSHQVHHVTVLRVHAVYNQAQNNTYTKMNEPSETKPNPENC